MYHNDAALLWRALYGSQRGLLGVHSALRPAPGCKRLSRHRSRFFDYPAHIPAAAAWCLGNSEEGLEAYFCAHLLLAKRRVKENAAPVLALWADADGGAPVLAPHAPDLAPEGRGAQPQAAAGRRRRPLRLGPLAAPPAAGDPKPQVRGGPHRAAPRARPGRRLPPEGA